MPTPIKITLTNSGNSIGPTFDLYCIDSFGVVSPTPFDQGVPLASLQVGYNVFVSTTCAGVRVQSIGDCTTYTDISIVFTSTTTSTTSTTSTTTTTTLKPGAGFCFPIPLTSGCICNYQTFDTTNFNSNFIPPPCGNYIGNDIWFSVIVPPSGELVISTSALQITDGAFAIYPLSIVNNVCTIGDLMICVDDAQGSYMPETHLTGLIPSQTILIRFWGYGGSISGQVGTFDICVFNPICTDPTIDGIITCI